jgi:hypothetical protein
MQIFAYLCIGRMVSTLNGTDRAEGMENAKKLTERQRIERVVEKETDYNVVQPENVVRKENKSEKEV